MLAALKAFYRPTLLALLALLTGCGIRVEVAPGPTVPTPAPRIGGQRIGIDPTWITRSLATPRLVFSDAQNAQGQLFMGPRPVDAILVKERHLWLTVEYDATWFASPQGNGRVRLAVYTRSAADQPWKLHDSAEKELASPAAPANQHDILAVAVNAQDSGQLQIRAEVSVAVFPGSNQAPANQSSTVEFNLVALSDPGPIKADFTALKSPEGQPLDRTRPLLDWRGWAGGPCALLNTAQDDPARASIEASCSAARANDSPGAIRAGQTALTQTRNPLLLARLHDMIGLALTRQGSHAEASTSFSKAVAAWGAQDRAGELSISLHNLASMVALQGNLQLATQLFGQLHELRSQFDDPVGRMLTQANLGRLAGDRGALAEAHTYFEQNGLPQAVVTRAWLDELGSGH
jgi:hypothetical protein